MKEEQTTTDVLEENDLLQTETAYHVEILKAGEDDSGSDDSEDDSGSK